MMNMNPSDFPQDDETSEVPAAQDTERLSGLYCQHCGHDIARLDQTTRDCPKCGLELDWPAIRRNIEAVDVGKVKSASAWTMLNYGSRLFISFGNQILLAWLLFPEAFGVIALVQVVMFGVHQLSDLGSRQMIVQSKREDRAFLDTIWTIQVARSIMLWIVVCALAYPLALVWREEMLLWLLPVAGIEALFYGFESTNEDSARRRLTIGRLNALDLASYVTSVVVTLTCAYVWPSVWAFVIGALAGGCLRMVLTHTVLPGPANRLRWDRTAVAELGSFGRWIFISTAVGFVAMKIDTLLLGRFLDSATLGVYDIALRLVMMPLTIIWTLAQNVLLPVLSQQARVAREEFIATFYTSRDLILDVGKACVVGVVLLCPAFFGFLYRSEYSSAIWITQALSMFLWIALLRAVSDQALLAKGDSKSLMIANVCKLAVTTSCCVAGFHFVGLPGFLAGMVLGELAGYWTASHILSIHHELPIGSRDIIATLKLLVLLTLGLCAWRLVLPWFGLSDRVSSLVATLIIAPIPSFMVARKLLAAMKSKAKQA